MSQEDGELVPSERKTLVSEVVMYLLTQEATKVPAKKFSIVKTVLQHHSRSFRAIMSEAKEVLSQIFGYHLLESDGRFFMVNKYEPSVLSAKILREPREQRLRCCLLMLVLSVIFMLGGTVREEVIWEFLEKLDIKTETCDPVFGDVKKTLIKDYVHMSYLMYARRERSDPPILEFSSGPRADAEIPKRKLLEFVCKVYGKEEHDWPVQLTELEQEEATQGQRLSQLFGKRVRLSQPTLTHLSASQPSSSQQLSASSSQHSLPRRASTKHPPSNSVRSVSPKPGPSSRF